jgi:hypothetical protein
MQNPALRPLLVTVLCLTLAACGEPPAEQPPAAASDGSAAPAAPAAATEPAPRTPSPEGARVVFVSPADGDTVTSPVKVVFGLEGMSVVPAGDATPDSGHHHLLIDVAAPDLAQPLPKDEQHVHFGQGQTEAEVTLSPGSHTLQLVLGDANHIPHNPPVISAPITITVQ